MDKKLWLWRLHLFKMINLKSLKQTYYSHINKQLKNKTVMFWSLISHFLKIHVILKGYVILLLCIQLRHKYLKSAVTKCEGTQDYSKHHNCGASQIHYGTSVMCILSQPIKCYYRYHGPIKWLEKYDVLNSHVLVCSSVMVFAVIHLYSLIQILTMAVSLSPPIVFHPKKLTRNQNCSVAIGYASLNLSVQIKKEPV